MRLRLGEIFYKKYNAQMAAAVDIAMLDLR
jgi:hypothetical protein